MVTLIKRKEKIPRLIEFFKSLKDPCKLCLVKASCYKEMECPLYKNYIRAKRTLKSWLERVATITLLVLAVFGVICVFVLIILGSIKFYELLF